VLSAVLTRTNGRLVRRLTTTPRTATVDLRGLPKGTYVVRVLVRVRVRPKTGATRTIVRRYPTCQTRR
jgi:hypothetical protein